MNLSSPKTCGSLTAECSLPPFLSRSEAISLDPKILRVNLATKFHFQSQQLLLGKKKEGLMKVPVVFVILCFPCITGYELASD